MDHPLPTEAPKPLVKQSLEFDENLEEFVRALHLWLLAYLTKSSSCRRAPSS